MIVVKSSASQLSAAIMLHIKKEISSLENCEHSQSQPDMELLQTKNLDYPSSSLVVC